VVEGEEEEEEEESNGGVADGSERQSRLGAAVETRATVACSAGVYGGGVYGQVESMLGKGGNQ